MIFGAACLRFAPAYYGLDISPAPDAVEYALTGLSLYEKGAYTLVINGQAYPPRYPFGFPLLLTPWFAIFGPQIQSALYGSFVWGLAAVTAGMAYAYRLYGRTAALVVGLVIGSSKIFIAGAQEVMSDSAGSVIMLLAALLVYVSLDRSRPRLLLFMAGVLCGLGVAVGYSNAAPALLLLAVAVALQPGGWRGRLQAALAICAGMALLILPLLTYHWLTFGNPLRTGYHYWVGAWYDYPRKAFNPRYLLDNPLYAGAGNLLFYGRSLAGLDGLYYTTPFVVAIFGALAAALWRSTRRRRQGLAILAAVTVSPALLYGVYIFQMARFLLLPVMGLAILGSGALAQWAGTAMRARGARWLQRAVALVLATTVAAGLLAGIVRRLDESYLWQTQVAGTAWCACPWQYEVAHFLDANIPENALIISPLSGPYIERLVLKDSSRSYMPLVHEGVEYADKAPGRAWPTAQDVAPDAVAAALEQGTPVYILSDPTIPLFAPVWQSLRARFVLAPQASNLSSCAAPLLLYRLAEASDEQ